MLAGGVGGEEHRCPLQDRARRCARLRAASEALYADFASRRLGVNVRLRDAGPRHPAPRVRQQRQHDRIADQQVVRRRVGGAQPCRFPRGDLAHRTQPLELAAGRVQVQPRFDPVPAALGGVHADRHSAMGRESRAWRQP